MIDHPRRSHVTAADLERARRVSGQMPPLRFSDAGPEGGPIELASVPAEVLAYPAGPLRTAAERLAKLHAKLGMPEPLAEFLADTLGDATPTQNADALDTPGSRTAGSKTPASTLGPAVNGKRGNVELRPPHFSDATGRSRPISDQAASLGFQFT